MLLRGGVLLGGRVGVGREQLGRTFMAGEGFQLSLARSQERAVMRSAHPGTEGEGVFRKQVNDFIYTCIFILGSFIYSPLLRSLCRVSGVHFRLKEV